MALPEFTRQPHRLLAEEQPVPALEAGLSVGATRAGGRVPAALERWRGRGEETREIRVALPVEPRPVVETRAPPPGVVEVESERADQVEPRVGRHAQPPDRTRVLRNERLDENDVQSRSAVVGHVRNLRMRSKHRRLTFARETTLLPPPAGCASSNSSASPSREPPRSSRSAFRHPR